MFTDDSRCAAQDEIVQRQLRAFRRIMTVDVFDEAARRIGVVIGKNPLHLGNLAWLGVVCALHWAESFTSVLVLTLTMLRDAEGFAATPLGRQETRRRKRKPAKKSKHDPYGSGALSVTEEAFVQARQKMPWEFWIALVTILAGRFAARHDRLVRWKRFRLLALDGTTVRLPRDKRLEEAFGVPRNGRSKTGARPSPQARMVMLQFPLTRVPWRFELGPLSTGERPMCRPLLDSLERDDLLLMDRGFWGLGLFWQIQNRGAFFGIRLIANARFQTLRRLGPKDRLVRYAPRDRRKRWRQEGCPESITLRVIDYQVPGYRPSALVTNVLDPQAISRAEWTRLTASREPGGLLEPGLYHRRWEIETSFRELKIQQGMEGSLRGRTAAAIRYEIAGHVLLYLLTRWMMTEAAVEHEADPLRISFTEARRELDRMQALLIISSPRHVSRTLLPRLLERIASHRVPLRPGRHYPRSNDLQPKNKGKGQFALPSKLKTKS